MVFLLEVLSRRKWREMNAQLADQAAGKFVKMRRKQDFSSIGAEHTLMVCEHRSAGKCGLQPIFTDFLTYPT
jgi:hypothetical protein